MSNQIDQHARVRSDQSVDRDRRQARASRDGRAPLQPHPACAVGGDAAADGGVRSHLGVDVPVLDPPRTRPWRDQLRGRPRHRRVHRDRRAGRRRRHHPHRALVPRRGAQRRPSGLGGRGGARRPDQRPVYLELARAGTSRSRRRSLASAVPRAESIGIQIENELYDQPEHIATLKRLAREAGLSAPLWTATGWGGAILPPTRCSRSTAAMPTGSGRVRGRRGTTASATTSASRTSGTIRAWAATSARKASRSSCARSIPSSRRPPVSSAAAWRRPTTAGRSRAAATSPRSPTSRSETARRGRASTCTPGASTPPITCRRPTRPEYPNDLPRFDYDFQAAIGATGHPAASLGLLRDHNAFLAAFGGRLADMFSSLPDDAPIDIHDLESLRWAVRTDGDSGFLFINTHQPHEPLAGIRRRPVPDRPGRRATSSCPIGRSTSPAGSSRAGRSASTSQACGSSGRRHPSRASSTGQIPTLVLRAHDGSRRASASRRGRAFSSAAKRSSLTSRSISSPGTRSSWTAPCACSSSTSGRRSASGTWAKTSSTLRRRRLARTRRARPARRAPADRDPLDGVEQFVPLDVRDRSAPGTRAVDLITLRPAGEPPIRYGEFMGRSSAPTDAQIDRGRRRLEGRASRRACARRRGPRRARHRLGGGCRSAARSTASRSAIDSGTD